jgi:hypothetical protein
MTLGSYLAGMALFALVIVAAIVAAMTIAARLPELRGAPRAVAVALLATATLIGIHLVPAALGVMTRGTVALAAALTLAGAIAVWRRTAHQRSRSRNLSPADSRGLTPDGALAAVAVAGLAIYLAAMLARFGSTPVTFIDTVTFHLPGVARWIQSNSIWQIDQFLPGQAQGYYPNNGNVVDLAAVLPWHSEFLIRFVNLPFLALTGVAGYAAGRELGVPRASSAIAAAAALSYPAVTSYVVDSPTPDAVMYATFAGGLLFLLRHIRSGERPDLLLAGLGLGIASGTRWYGVAATAVVVGVWVLARLAFERRPRVALADLAWIAIPIALAGGVWLVRNWVESGNPFFPVRVDPLGITIFDAPADPVRALVGFTLGGYLGNGAVLSDFILPALKVQLGYVAVALTLGTLAAALMAVRDRRDPARARVLGLAIAAFGLAVVYLITPYTALGLRNEPYELGANVRYLVPALLVAAPAVAWGLGRCRGGVRIALEALLVLLALDGLRRGVDVSAADAIAGAAIVATAGLLGFAIVTAQRHGRVAWAAGLAALTAAIVVVGARGTQNTFLDHRYISVTTPLDAALARAAGGETDIGLAGAWPVTTLSPVLALFGPELDNRVSYVGDTRDGMLYPYEDANSYARAVQAGGYDLIMVGHEKPLAFPIRDLDTWTREAGYREVEADGNFTLFAAPAG